MNVMLLAAGEGTRLRPYTLTLPKPAMPFLNIPLAAHSLGFLDGVNVDKLVVNTFHLAAKIHSLFEGLPHGAKELIFSDEKGKILGSGGGLGNAREHFKGGRDFVMMNADEVILPKNSNVFNEAVNVHKKSHALATLMVKDHPGVGTQFGGVWVDADNKVLGFGKTALPGAVRAWHFIGVQILSEKVFDFIPAEGESNILYDALTTAIQQGHLVQAFPFECTWFETGNPHDYLEATAECLKILSSEPGPEKQRLQKVLSRFGAHSVVENKPEGIILKEPSAKISAFANVSGYTCVGKDAEVGDGCFLKNVVVYQGAKIIGTQDQDKIYL